MPQNPPMPLLATTRWQGINGGSGLRAIADAAARAAPCRPARAANCP
jgi:hypothetical protein